MRSIILPLTLSLTLGLVACQTAPLPQTIQQQSQVSAIQGQVHWPTRPGLQVQATLEDIQTQATVSLIYPSDHPTQPNRTIATGLTNASGQFIINPDSNFTPAQGTVLVLEASKRVQGPGADLLTLRTFLRWEGSNGWNSITGSSVSLNTLTTAIAILASVENSFSSADTIGTVSQGVLNTTLGSISSETVGVVQNLVEQSLWENQDPGHVIYRNGETYARLITTPAPTPTATSDISVIERTTFNGSIFDDTAAPLDGVTVTAKSLNSSVPFEETTTTAGGAYAFNNAPAGVQIEIVATRAGFTTRRRVEVLTSNPQSSPNVNKYDFGTDGNDGTNGTLNNALSDLPEVTRVTPGRNASGVDPKTSFVLGFSEPMDRQTVEDTFSVRSYNDRKLTVDSGSAANTVTGNSTINTINGTRIWDKDAFNISWNSDNSEVTFTFKEERLLPTDKDSNLVPDYRVSFANFNNPTDRLFKDASGVGRNHHHFKLTDGPFEESYKFSIVPDTAAPSITGVTAETDENGGQNGDAIRVRYSERMIIYSRDKSIAGGMDGISGSATKAAAAYPGTGESANAQTVARNYDILIAGQSGVTKYAGNWAALGGTAVYDPTDLTHKTVLLLPGMGGFTATGDTVNAQTLTVTATQANGIVVTPGALTFGANTYTEVQAQLNSLFTGTPVTLSIVDNGGATKGLATAPAAGDRHVINIAAGAEIGGQAIRSVTITGGSAAERLGFMANDIIVGGTNTIGGRGNYYVPGDTVRVTVASTVLDPAGNTLDNSSNSASATAS